MIEPHRIANELGISATHISYKDLSDKVHKGLAKRSVNTLLDSVFGNTKSRNEYLYSIIPEGTYKARKKLSESESEKITRIARVVATARKVFDDTTDSNLFFLTPHKALENKRPIDITKSELGAIQVEDILWKIYYGLPV